MDPKPASESCALISHWMGVTDANSSGNIHGGTIMKLADEAAGLAALKHARQRVVTVGMDRMDFLVPIYVGELVMFKATVDADGHPAPVAAITASSPAEQRRMREAEMRRTNRLAERAEIVARRAQEA